MKLIMEIKGAMEMELLTAAMTHPDLRGIQNYVHRTCGILVERDEIRNVLSSLFNEAERVAESIIKNEKE